MIRPPLSGEVAALLELLPDFIDMADVVIDSGNAEIAFAKVKDVLIANELWPLMTKAQQNQLKGFMTYLYERGKKYRLQILYEVGAVRVAGPEVLGPAGKGITIKKKENPLAMEVWPPDKGKKIKPERKSPPLDYSTWQRPMYDTSGKVKPLGKKQNNPLIDNIQSIVFAKEDWSLTEARTWLKLHGFKFKNIDEKPNTWRFRQKDPKSFDRYYTIVLETGLNFVMGNKKKRRNPQYRNRNLLFELFMSERATAEELAELTRADVALVRDTLKSLISEELVMKVGRYYMLTDEGESCAIAWSEAQTT